MAAISGLPPTLNVDLYAGDGFAVQLNFVLRDTGDPYPLDGTWAAEIRSSGTLITSWLIDTSDAATGILRLSLDGTQTRGLLDTKAVWDLQQTLPGEHAHTWYRGTVRTLEDVTLP